MSVVAATKTPGEKEHRLWGVKGVIQLAGVRPRRTPPLLPWERNWIAARSEGPATSLQYPLSAPSSVTKEITVTFERFRKLGVRVPAPDEVWQYLEEHPNFIEITRDLVELAAERLLDAVLSLEISRDPEGDEEHVVLYARFNNYDEAAVKRIRDVRKEFLLNLREEEEWPLLTTDFRSPQEE